MLDKLDQFTRCKDGDLDLQDAARRSAGAASDTRCRWRSDALKTLSARYGFTPNGPILVEIFPDHDDFAVRNLGLPGMIGALGACFGRVVTHRLADGAARPGTFSWQATLWHELAHVDHAADVEAARAALADRRHFGLRGRSGSVPSGDATWK